MTLSVLSPDWRSADGLAVLYHGDCRDVLASLPERSVHVVCTSPPYWGLRDYGIEPVEWADGETCVWGMEETIDGYLRHTLEVMAAIRRVLRDDGVVWWNIGDSYASGGRADFGPQNGKQQSNKGSVGAPRPDAGVEGGSKLLIPHRVAIALQDAGWCVRQDCVWGKKSPMPESIGGWRWTRCRVKVKPMYDETNPHGSKLRDGLTKRIANVGGVFTRAAEWTDCPGCQKCEPHGGYVLRRGNWRHTTAHEYVFMLTKGMGYFSDGEAVKERSVAGHPSGNGFKRDARLTYDGRGSDEQWNAEQRNPRSVFHLSNEPYSGAHFATYPTKLILPLIKAATSSAGCCPECGQCWAPVVETERKATRPGNDSKVGRVSDDPDSPYHGQNGAVVGNRDPQRHIQVSSVKGHRQTCDCEPEEPVPCTVLDICNGSGTTGQVARHLGLRYIGMDCSAEYLELAKQRIETPLVKSDSKRVESLPGQMELFAEATA